MSGKGSSPRPFSVDQATFASHWDAIFSGSGVTGSASVSTTEGSRSSLDSPAIYIDDTTGIQVNEGWWPGDPVTHERAS